MGDGTPEAELRGMLAVARDHREHERYHSLLKLEEAAAMRRDSNTLKVLADRWTAPGGPEPAADPAHGAVGCADLNDRAAVATTGVLFMEGGNAPAELTAMTARLAAAATRYQGISAWLAREMDAEWPRLTALLTPGLVAAARPRFGALANTSAAGTAYGLAARQLAAGVRALENQDLTPSGIRAAPDAAAAMLRTAAWLVDAAAATLAEAAARLSRSDPEWTAFIAALAAHLDDAGPAEAATP